MQQARGPGIRFGAALPQVAKANETRRTQATEAAVRLRGILAPMAATRVSLRAIARALEVAGVPTPSRGRR